MLAIENEAIFKAQGLKNEFIHESIQQKKIRANYNRDKAKEDKIKQQPIYIHTYIANGVFTINGYGTKGIECLNIWVQLLKKHPEIENKPLVIQSTESTLQIGKTETYYTYSSNNWVAYRNCKLVDGFYYDYDKTPNQLVNFEKRLKKNIETFLKETCGYEFFEPNSLYLIIKKIKSLGKNTALNKQEKEYFKITFQCKYNLPDIFSLGQNVAYGNGVFYKM